MSLSLNEAVFKSRAVQLAVGYLPNVYSHCVVTMLCSSLHQR